MVKETIRVYARLKPLGRRQQAGIYSVDDDEKSVSSLEIIVPHDLADGFVNNKRENYKFKFQKIFDQEAKQDVVFDSIARPVAECALAGYNGTIFAYGQTGSGKTFTITGGAERYSDRGIIPRTLSYIFDQLQKDNSKMYTTHVSYLEIYNECGYDLLNPRHEASRLEDLPKVTIMEDPDQNIHLKNLSLQQANSEEEALNLLFLGDTNRMIAETPMNQASTRSHCIFTIHISSKEPGSATIRRSKLHLVDLAGSERVAKTGVGGHLLTEAKYINLSLHYLEQVIIALAEKNRSHIPYRNSMMTSVLRDSLGGNCMTTMIATLSLDKRNIDESISTCRFAQRVALIKNEAVLNEEVDPRLMVVQLQKEIQELKDELALVTGNQRTSELSQEELLQLDKLIEMFLEDNDPESTLDVGADMRKIKYCFSHVKQLMNHSKISDKKTVSQHISEEKDTNKEAGTEELKKLKELLQQRDNEINILVNMLKKEKKKAQDALFQLNVASAGSTALEQSLPINLEEKWSPSNCFSLKEAKDLSSSVNRLPFLSRQTGGKMSLGCQEAFEVFKWDHADSITIEDNKQLLKQRFAEAKCLGEKINEVRNKINHLKGELTQRHIQRVVLAVSNPSEELNTLDPVEEKLRTQIEEEKKSYKTMFNRLKGLKVEIEHLQLLMEKAKVKLQKDFEVWWSEESTNLQVCQEKTELVRSLNRTTVYPQFIKSSQPLPTNSSVPEISIHPPTMNKLLQNLKSKNLTILPSTGKILKLKTTRASSNEETSGKNNSNNFNSSTSKTRTSPSSNTPIPLTGDSQIDADILAFIKARQNILLKKVPNWQISWTPLLVLGYLFYLLLGAMVFQLLEKQAETHSRDQFQLEKLKFLQNYTCLDRQALEQFVQVLMEAWEKGVSPEGNSTNPSNWDFSNSFFFAGTVVTTIGYGNRSPSTVAGQVFCVFYALFGVPLNLAFLNQLGKGLNAHLMMLERWVQKEGRAQVVQTLAVAVFLTTGTLLFLVFPPLVFSYVEGWSYGEGFYFTFITLSTIGFGDYVVGTNPNKHYIPLYRSLTAIWIVFGLAWLALVFNVGADLMEKFLQLKWHKPDLSLAEGDTTKLEDEPEQPRVHIPT